MTLIKESNCATSTGNLETSNRIISTINIPLLFALPDALYLLPPEEKSLSLFRNIQITWTSPAKDRKRSRKCRPRNTPSTSFTVSVISSGWSMRKEKQKVLP